MSYTLIIAEKPNASRKIAEALSNGKPKMIQTEDGVKYYEFTRNKKKHIVVPAVGHLFSLKDSSKGWAYPTYDYEWKPTFEISKRAAFAEKYLKNMIKVGKGADEFILACDFDIEGSVIGFNALRFACKRNSGKRMKFSTLTKQDLVDSYEHMMKHLDTPQIESGLARHELDFLWGVNTSRALTLSIKKGGKKLNFYLLSAGRVQTPMLHFLMKKEKQIQAFKPKPYWQLEAQIALSKKLIVVCNHREEKFWKKPEAEKVFKKAKKTKKAMVHSIETKQYKQRPPTPFDLTTLQTEAYRFFGWSPRQTTNIAQKLYEGGYISYPRTSSQKLPPQIGYKNILDNLGKISSYKKLVEKLLKGRLQPNEGKKVDAAHPAVYPTAEIPDSKRLNAQQKKLYDLISRRFLAVFAEPATRESMKITFDLNGEKFPTVGRRTIEKGWTEYYGRFAKADEVKFPSMKKGDTFDLKKIQMLDKKTSPPPRYSQGSIVKEMEKHNIGTKTTRATILQTLYDRGYVVGKSIEVTGLGMQVAKTLSKYVPEIVSEDLTRKFEKSLEKIEKGKLKRENTVKNAKKIIGKISKEFKKNEIKIGKELENAILKTKEEQSRLGSCPTCDDGDLKILFSPFTKKRFVGCSNYNKCAVCGFSRKACKCKCPNCGNQKGKCKCTLKEKQWTPTCSTGYPLPLSGSMTNTGGICEKCKTPIIQVWRKGKRPFRMCLDPKCETKKDWLDKSKMAKKEKPKEVKKTVKKKAVKKLKKVKK